MLERLKNCIRRVLREKGGFNTLDVTAAMGITAALAAITVPALMGAMDTGKINATVDEIKNIRGALIKFYADTKSLPVVTTDGKNEGAVFLNGDTTTGSEKTGLWVNPKNLKGWNGPYIERPLAENQFGGTYGLDYDLNLDVRGTGADSTGLDDPAFFLTNIKAEAQRIIDERLDDGVANKGFIQSVATTTTEGGGTTRSASSTFDEANDLVVVIFEDIETGANGL